MSTEEKNVFIGEQEESISNDILQISTLITNLIKKANMDKISAIISFGMAARMILSEDEIKKILLSEEIQKRIDMNDNEIEVPQLTDELVDTAIRSFSVGLSNLINIKVFKIDSRLMEQQSSSTIH